MPATPASAGKTIRGADFPLACLDASRALEPLQYPGPHTRGEPPETFPSGV